MARSTIGLLCYESVITDRRRQRRGYARRVIASLAAWAKDQGAKGACLEVEARNTRRLARSTMLSGLKTELYRYHYRREPARELACDKTVRLATG